MVWWLLNRKLSTGACSHKREHKAGGQGDSPGLPIGITPSRRCMDHVHHE